MLIYLLSEGFALSETFPKGKTRCVFKTRRVWKCAVCRARPSLQAKALLACSGFVGEKLNSASSIIFIFVHYKNE